MEMESQKGSPLNYGSEFLYITEIKNLFSHNEEKYIIVDIIQKGSRYHLSPIQEAVTISHQSKHLTQQLWKNKYMR